MEAILFYLALTVQIVVVSIYFPLQIVARARSAIANYPPEEYPKLYAWPVEHWRQAATDFENRSRLAAAVGLLLLGVTYWFDLTSSLKAMFAIQIGYSLLQWLPNLLRVLSERKKAEVMRAEPMTSVRTAELHSRRLLDFVSPTFIAAIVLTFIVDVYICITYAIEADAIAGVMLVIALVALSALLTNSVRKLLAGEAPLPLQMTPEDRANLVRFGVRSMVDNMLRLNVCMAVVVAVRLYGLVDYLPALLAVLIALNASLESIRELGVRDEDYDLSVFKRDSAKSSSSEI